MQHVSCAALTAFTCREYPCLCFRLTYAAQRLQFAMQLSQAEVKPDTSNLAGFAQQTRLTARGSTGFTTAAAASQSVEGLQLEVQRLATDRAMLMKQMQVCICPRVLDHAKCYCSTFLVRRLAVKGRALIDNLCCGGTNNRHYQAVKQNTCINISGYSC